MLLQLRVFTSLRIARKLIRKKFESHAAAKASIFCLADHAHPTAAQPLQNAVVRYGLTDH